MLRHIYAFKYIERNKSEHFIHVQITIYRILHKGSSINRYVATN